MKSESLKLFTLLSFLLLAVGAVGCTGAEVAGAIGQIVVGGLTGDEQLAADFGQAVQASVEQQQQEEFLLSKLPPGVRCDGGQLYCSENGDTIYSRPDQSWYRWVGGQWLEGE